ncbi:HalOD1 output domain-containing protein [Natrinema soli]|uniref:HalOD1 output domain-containing protein n=1 Tax=Natrinema soli TaxID=1930624 RepID=A0ABD5SMR3_9EURY|nr:HalOD1 output domain-containing protein [Natrinema soli]
MLATIPTSIRVVQGVAAHEGTDPMDLEPPLHAVIDTDALDALFRPAEDASAATASIEFAYRDKHVTVDSAGRVDVTADDADHGGSTGPGPGQ